MRNYGKVALAVALVLGLMSPTSAIAASRHKHESHVGKVASQTLVVGDVTPEPVDVVGYTATSESQARANREVVHVHQANAIAGAYHVSYGVAYELSSNSGARQRVVETALSYLGVPYVLGGASRSGIDCSGLTMVAYASVGVGLVHYVTNQDDVAQPLPQNRMRPGDLMIFDDDEHVAIYIGQGLLVAAPTEGRNVEIESMSDWNGIPWHGGRILP